MFEDLLEQVESSGHDVRLLIRSYTPDYLGWSLEVMASPLEETSSPDPQVHDDALEAPSSQSPSASAAAFTNITLASVAEQDEYEELVRAAYQGRFNFSDPKESSVNGVAALEMDGTGVEDSIWGSYDASVFLITNAHRLLTISLVYQRSEDNTYKNLATDVLSGMVLGDAPAPTPTPQTSSAPPSPSPTPRPTATATPTAQPTEAPAGNFFQNLWHNIQEAFFSNPNLVYYILIAVAVILLAIALIVHLHNVRRHKRWLAEEEDEWRHVNSRIAQELQSQSQKGSPSQPRKLQKIEDKEMFGEESSQNANKEHDYTEDIFRYTQQPGPEVNDVSRFTHGYDDEVDDELKKLQDQSFVEPQPSKVQSVGSRVERNRRKRGK